MFHGEMNYNEQENENDDVAVDEETPLRQRRKSDWINLTAESTGRCVHENQKVHVEAIRDRSLRWHALSKEFDHRLKFWSYVNLSLQIGGAALSTLATQLQDYGWGVGVLGLVCLAFVPVIASNFLGHERHGELVRTRHVAELVKSEYYLFLAKVRPYDNEKTRFGMLLERVREHQSLAEDVRAAFARMSHADVKGYDTMPPTTSKEGYVSERLDKEYQKLRNKAKKYSNRGMRLSIIQYTFGGIAALIGMLSGSVGGAQNMVNDVTEQNAQALFVQFVSTKLGAWAAVFATATAATSSFISMSKYYELAAMFSGSAQMLEDCYLLAREQNFFKKRPDEWSKFVIQCEDIIVQENDKWAAIEEKKAENQRASVATSKISFGGELSASTSFAVGSCASSQSPIPEPTKESSLVIKPVQDKDQTK